MQMLDQQVAPPLALAEQRLHLRERRRIDLPPFRMIRPAAPPRARMDAPVVFCPKSHDETSGLAVIASPRVGAARRPRTGSPKQSRLARSTSARDCFVA